MISVNFLTSTPTEDDRYLSTFTPTILAQSEYFASLVLTFNFLPCKTLPLNQRDYYRKWFWQIFTLSWCKYWTDFSSLLQFSLVCQLNEDTLCTNFDVWVKLACSATLIRSHKPIRNTFARLFGRLIIYSMSPWCVNTTRLVTYIVTSNRIFSFRKKYFLLSQHVGDIN